MLPLLLIQLAAASTPAQTTVVETWNAWPLTLVTFEAPRTLYTYNGDCH